MTVEENAWAFAISTLCSGSAYFLLFSFLFRSRLELSRHVADSLRLSDIEKKIVAGGTAPGLATEVVLATLTFVLALTAVVLLFFDSTVSGRFFFLTSLSGGSLLAWATARVAGLFKHLVGAGLEHYFWAGQITGMSMLVLSNVAAFYFKIPSSL